MHNFIRKQRKYSLFISIGYFLLGCLSLCTYSVAESSQPTAIDSMQQDTSEDRVEIIDYKNNQILGYMVLKNGSIVRRVLYKEPKEFQIYSLSPSTVSKDLAPSSKLGSTSYGDSVLNDQNPLPRAQDLKQTKDTNITGASNDNTQVVIENPTQQADTKQVDKQQLNYEKQLSNTNPDTKSSKIKQNQQNPNRVEKQSKPISIPQKSGREATITNQAYQDRQWDKKKIPHDIQTQTIILE